MNSLGGARTGAGRKPIGERKTIALTLHPSVWKAIEHELEAAGGTITQADLLRAVITNAYWDKMELMGLELPVYKSD